MEGKEGWVYVLSNKAMAGLVKVGYSMRDPTIRAEEISNSTGVPLPYIVSYRALVVSPNQVEQDVHLALDDKRVNEKREFFKCKIMEAIQAIRKNSLVKYEEINMESLNEIIAPDENNPSNGALSVRYPDGSRYVGESHHGLRHGFGTMTWPDGRKYTGDWIKHRFEGHGSMTWSDGRKYTGQWKAGKRHGFGTQTTDAGGVWKGFWSEDEFRGNMHSE